MFRRPATVTASAVMSIIYGALVGLCGLFGLVMMATGAAGPGGFGGGNVNQNDPALAKLQKAIEDSVDEGKAVRITNAVSNAILPLCMLIGGIGLLSLHSWARILIFVTAALAICNTSFHAGYILFVQRPAAMKALRDFEANFEAEIAKAQKEAREKKVPPPEVNVPPQLIKGFEFIYNFLFLLIGLTMLFVVAYLAIIIILLLTPAARRGFAHGGYDRDDDLDDDRFRRRRDDEEERGYRDRDDDRGRDDDRFDRRRDEPDDRFR